MPMSGYDKYFGGGKGSAAKAKAAMIAEYGSTKGIAVFYADGNKKKKKSSASAHLADHQTGRW